jgi:hypothetical protein
MARLVWGNKKEILKTYLPRTQRIKNWLIASSVLNVILLAAYVLK